MNAHVNEELDKEIEVIVERLARIEQNQLHFSKQLDKLVSLLDRMVKVEEHVEQHKDTMKRLYARLECVEKELSEAKQELQRWKTGRKILAWLMGSSAFIAIVGFAIKIMERQQ